MTTMVENERLAVLENQYKTLQSDVSEIKSDVKALVIAHTALERSMVMRESAALQDMKSRSSTGVWVRSLVPWIIATATLAVALTNTIDRLHIFS